MRSVLSGLAVSLVSLLVALLLAEVAVRTFYPQRLYYNISRWDPDTGFAAIPGIESRQRNAEYTMTVKINSRGLRDREFSREKPPGTLRVGVFGDSFTFGEGVEAEETWPKRLEALLAGAAPGVPVEVINFGLGKTGTSHQLALYRKEGRHYGLDVVVVGFLAANDFTDNLAGVYRLVEGELVHDVTPYSSVRRIQAVVYAIPGYRWLAENSHLVNLVRLAATGLDDRQRTGPGGAGALTDTTRDELAVSLTLRLLEAFADEAAANGSRFLVVSLPARDQPLPGDGAAAGPNYVRRLAALQPALAGAGINVVDLVPVFAGLQTGGPYYYEVDGHMRPAGHEVIARHVLPAVRDALAAAGGTP